MSIYSELIDQTELSQSTGPGWAGAIKLSNYLEISQKSFTEGNIV